MQLVAYQEQTGHGSPPQTRSSDGTIRKLGSWCNRQRTFRKRGDLSQERIDKLDSLELWKWVIRREGWEDDIWHKHLVLVSEYAKCKGDTDLPTTKLMYKGKNIGSWCKVQRNKYKTDDLKPERISAIEKRVPHWFWDRNEWMWSRHYRALEQYQLREGTCVLSRSTKEDDLPIGKWVNSQRVAYEAGTLIAKRVEMLKKIPGWSFCPYSDTWNSRFRDLNWFIKQNGRWPKSGKSASQDERSLRSWVDAQKQKLKNNKLKAEHLAELERLDGWVPATASVQKSHRRLPLMNNTPREYGGAVGGGLWLQSLDGK